MEPSGLFVESFLGHLRNARVSGLTLRQYQHERGHSTDDPNERVRLFPVQLSDVSTKAFEIAHKGEARDSVALTSLVRVGIRTQRLLLLDLDIPKGRECEMLVRTELFRARKEFPNIFSRGALMETERSYHYVGLTPLSMRDWLQGMGVALLMNNPGISLMDTRYIGHSLVRGYGALCLLKGSSVATPSLLIHI